MTIRVKEELQLEELTVLADKGYTTGAELSQCAENGITTFCSPKGSSSNHNGLYNIEEFKYDSESDSYQCPQGHELTTNGRLFKKGATYRMKRYKTKECQHCPLKAHCTRNEKGRFIERHEFQDAIDANRTRVESNKDYYRKRQQIIEHQFGTLKRQWHFDHTLMRGLENVLAEVFLVSICYNLRRLMSIHNGIEYLEAFKEYKSLNLGQIGIVSDHKGSQNLQIVSATGSWRACLRTAC
ncbi:transposase [Portibacter lacus]|uniref:Transposase DDE domain-containing protein n=1 Tax=Portibacter lacus TaxID=1099794 RepID=A0AA37WG98_9BACT|nr:transposase [Portibacter lacus]GLR18239.1 hypothetical protein GCM10007940_28540 [Portibacter lacus]